MEFTGDNPTVTTATTKWVTRVVDDGWIETYKRWRQPTDGEEEDAQQTLHLREICLFGGHWWWMNDDDGWRESFALSLSLTHFLSHSLSLCCLLSVVQFRVYGGFDSGVQYTTMYLSWTTHENIYTYMYYRRWCGVGLSWRDGDDCVWWWWYVDDGRVVVCSVACSHDANLLVECCLWGGGCVSTVEKNEWWFLLKK